MKPENRFIGRVNKKLPDAVYVEKTNNPYRGGIPDCYYEGDYSILWVEYKWLPAVPPRINLTDDKGVCLSRLQQQWLTRAQNNGVPTAVIVGAPGGGVIYPRLSWMTDLPREEFKAKMITDKEIAEWLAAQLLRSVQRKPSGV